MNRKGKEREGIHLPDIGKLGIRVAVEMHDRRRVGPTNMAETRKLTDISRRIEMERQERKKILEDSQIIMKRRKKTLDSKRRSLWMSKYLNNPEVDGVNRSFESLNPGKFSLRRKIYRLPPMVIETTGELQGDKRIDGKKRKHRKHRHRKQLTSDSSSINLSNSPSADAKPNKFDRKISLTLEDDNDKNSYEASEQTQSVKVINVEIPAINNIDSHSAGTRSRENNLEEDDNKSVVISSAKLKLNVEETVRRISLPPLLLPPIDTSRSASNFGVQNVVDDNGQELEIPTSRLRGMNIEEIYRARIEQSGNVDELFSTLKTCRYLRTPAPSDIVDHSSPVSGESFSRLRHSSATETH